MRRRLLVALGAFTALCLGQTAATADPFKCPHVGGDFVFGQEANINTLDQMTSATISTRNIAMNIYESLMTRDENNHPILELAEAMNEAPDHLTYTFKLRQGVQFHNGKPMTSADVVASFDRYAKVGNQRSTLANVERWEAPDAQTFVIHMKKVQPTFIDALVLVQCSDRDHSVGEPRCRRAQQLTQPDRDRPLSAGGIRARQRSQVEALRRLQAEHQLSAADRLRRLQAGLPRHGYVPHRDRSRGPRRRTANRANFRASRMCRRNRSLI